MGTEWNRCLPPTILIRFALVVCVSQVFVAVKKHTWDSQPNEGEGPFGTPFQVFLTMNAWFCCFGPVVAQYIIAEAHDEEAV